MADSFPPKSSSTLPPPLPAPSIQSFLDPIPGLIPYGSICTLSGASGTGKTRMMAGWLKRWVDGKTICGHQTNRPTAIGIIAVDRRWSQYQALFHQVGLPDIPHVAFRDMINFPWANLRTAAGRIGALKQAFDRLRLPAGALIMVDPLSVFVTNKLMDYSEVAIGMSEIDKELKSRQFTCLGAFHTHKVYANKNDRTLRPQDRILGSGAQIAFTDTSIYLASPAEMDEPYYELGFIPHNAAPEQHHFSMDKTGLFIPFARGGKDSKKSTDERIAAMMLLIPEPDGISGGDLLGLCIENFGISRATYFRDVQKAQSLSMIEIDELGYIRRRKVN